VRRGRTDRQSVAFSFDAGSDVGATYEILDILADHGITASFSLTGDWTRLYPAAATAVADAGHHLINHGDHHRSLTGYSTDTERLTAAEVRSEIAGADNAIRTTTGRSPGVWFRPPYGDLDDASALLVAAAGTPMIAMWTVDSLGWKGLPPADVARRCLDLAVPGAIYVFHVGSASTDVDALTTIIAGLAAAGYTIGSVPSVL
jgi:peptidoglycan/xylan/chitin deacetylase (PgdA/CDA1 family)